MADRHLLLPLVMTEVKMPAQRSSSCARSPSAIEVTILEPSRLRSSVDVFLVADAAWSVSFSGARPVVLSWDARP